MTASINLIGLFRSGTNYARAILEWNYDVRITFDAYGWKHAMVPTFSNYSSLSHPDGGLLVVVRNPYSALLSWYNYATTNGRNLLADTRSFSSFIRNRICFRDGTNKSLAPEYWFANPVQMWNAVVWNHLSVARQVGGFVVEYEALLRRPESTCDEIARHLNLTRKTGDFAIPGNVLRNMNDRRTPRVKSKYLTHKEFDGSFELEREYVGQYADADLAFVTRSLEADVVNRSGIRLEARAEPEADDSPALYTVSGDARLLPFACFLESNRANDNLPVRLIPFDEDIALTRELASLYGAQWVEPDPKWDRLGKALFGAEEYRPGIAAWKYFRKLNVFDGSPRLAAFADSNVVFLNSLARAFDALQSHDLVFGDRSKENRNFAPWAAQLLNILDPNLRHGFNASFWVTRCHLLADLDIDALVQRPSFRVMLGKAPEQSFLQLLALLSGKRLGGLGEIDERIRPTLWGDVSPPAEIAFALANKVTRNGKVPLAIKWSGTAFHRKEAMKSSEVYKLLFDGILERAAGCPELVQALTDEYRIAVDKA
jgi:hypothetical protein